MINRMKMALVSLVYTVIFTFVNFFSRKKLISNNKTIVSLTTYNQRVNTVFLTIESIFSQSLKPSRVILWLSKEERIVIPRSLKRLLARGLEIRYTEGNLKSYKKLSFAFDFYNEQIVTADDDIIYPNGWLAGLVNDSNENPNCVICYRGHDITFSFGNLDPYSKFSQNKSFNNEPTSNLVPTGCSGILYPVGSLSKEASYHFSEEFLRIAPDADDLWYKSVTLKNGFKSKRVMVDNIHFPPILTSLGEGLFYKNVKENENDSKLKACIEFFDIFSDEMRK